MYESALHNLVDVLTLYFKMKFCHYKDCYAVKLMLHYKHTEISHHGNILIILLGNILILLLYLNDPVH